MKTHCPVHAAASSGARARSKGRGFTLVELMIVVVIVGIVASLGTVAWRRQILAAKSNEATTVIRAIAAAQERYRGETMQYMDASKGSLTNFYPMATPTSDKKYEWHQTHTDAADWRLLNVTVPGPVQFGYAVVAGGPADALPDPWTQASGANFPWVGTFIKDPWYVIEAKGDLQAGAPYSVYVANSFNSGIYVELDGE